MERYAEALEKIDQALAGSRITFGEVNPRTARWSLLRGSILLDLKRPQEALAAFKDSLAIHERLLGPRAPRIADVETGIGESLVALGDRPGALAAFERALVLDREGATSTVTSPVIAYHVAEQLVTLGRDRPRACALASGAHRMFLAQPGTASEVKESTAFLARHCGGRTTRTEALTSPGIATPPRR